MTQAAIVGVGAGVGGLFLCAIGFLIFQIYTRREEHNREIAEIERGFPHAVNATQIQGQGTCPLPFIPSYMKCGGWNTLSSSDSVCRLPPFAHMDNRIYPAPFFREEQPRTGWAFPGKRPRIGRLPSRAKRMHALSAIIESPRSTPNAGSRASPAPGSGASAGPKHPLETTEQAQGQTQSDAAMTDLLLVIPPRAPSRATDHVGTPVPEASTTVKELPRPRTTRSKSLGTVTESTSGRSKAGVAGPRKTNMHNRHLSFAAPAPGPAPTGPLPPLPPLPRKISRRDHYDPSNRHSALGIPASMQNESASTSLNSSPDRNWERIINPGKADPVRDPTETVDKSEAPTQAGAECETDDPHGRGIRGPRSAPLGHRRSLVRLSITSNPSTRNSCSSIGSSLDRHVNRLSVPQIITADQVSMSRVSSSGSLGNIQSSVQVVSTPRRRAGSSRVSACGSPTEKPRSGALRAVSGNSTTPLRPMKSPLRNTTGSSFEWDKQRLGPKHSILKGSPRARKGHRRQNCVRLSTLAPTILGPRSRSNSPSLMDGIAEESSLGRQGGQGPVAEKYMNGDVTLRPRPCARETGSRRASLTPSSPTLSFAYDHQEPLAWGNGFIPGRVSYSPQRSRSAISQEVSLYSIPSLPSLSQLRNDEELGKIASTPAIAFTRPSTEWSENEHTPPFGLRVTPSASKQSFYDPESPSLPGWNKKYVPSWPVVATDPPASGQPYDPCRPISVDSSADESGSPDFPFAIRNEDAVNLNGPLPRFSFDKDGGRALPHDRAERHSSGYNKENHVLRAATELPSPFKSVPDFRPLPLNIDKSNTSSPIPPPSPSSSVCKTPPLLFRASSNNSAQTTGSACRQSRGQIGRRRRSRSPERRSNGGIDKSRPRVSGPRPSPPKDVRKSIMALRRMKSDIQVNETDFGRSSRRYLRLGRQASPELGWEFESEDTDAGEDAPTHLFAENVAPSPSSGVSVSSHTEARECHYVTYSPPKPVLSLLTTVPSANTPRTLTVWDEGEDYWEKQEQSVTEAVTASPVDTPTTVLNRILGESVLEAAKAGKGTETRRDWNRKSRAVDTPKSVRSLYDPQGFLRI